MSRTNSRRSEPPTFAWIEQRIRDAVAQAVAGDPNPADPFRGLYITDEHAQELAHEGLGGVSDERLRDAASLLGLDDLDTAILGLVAAPEVVPGYGRLYGYLHDDVNRKLPSPGLIVRLLADREDGTSVLERLSSGSRLRRIGAVRILEGAPETPLVDRAVKAADPLAGFLIGGDLAPGTATRLRRHPVPAHDIGRNTVTMDVRRRIARADEVPVLVTGPDAVDLIACAAEQPLLVIDGRDLVDPATRQEAVLIAALERRQLVVEQIDAPAPEHRAERADAVTALPGRIVVASSGAEDVRVLDGHAAVVVEVPEPTFDERRAAWAALSGATEVDDAATKFRLTINQIEAASRLAREAAAADGGSEVMPHHLDQGARQVSSGQLGELATRLRPTYTWDQLVLPDRAMGMLKSIFAFLRHRDLVLSVWGYERALVQSQGLKTLFAGESGTGKTMAAQVIAAELGLEIFRVDLATVVSKYIGETEKNLDRIFDAAGGSNAILFFDEADALFGRRSEVGDSHDRYANLEVAYLLQRMEGYPGAVVLATNFRHNIDEAFLRRLDVVVDFPFPDVADRERIWRIALPDAAPMADDLDLGFLAAQFKLSGGGIRNASLAGAFLAAEDSGVIGMEHLVQGVAMEYAKLGRLTMEADFERFHQLVRGGPSSNGDGSRALSGTAAR